MRCGVAIVLAIMSAMPAVAAPSTEDVLREFQFFGTWAVDCAKPPAPGNPHVSDTRASPGVIFEDHALGGSALNRYRIVGAERESATRLVLDVIFAPGKQYEERERLVLTVRDGTRRTMVNQAKDGPLRVNEGLVVGSGTRTPVLTKCD